VCNRELGTPGGAANLDGAISQPSDGSVSSEQRQPDHFSIARPSRRTLSASHRSPHRLTGECAKNARTSVPFE